MCQIFFCHNNKDIRPSVRQPRFAFVFRGINRKILICCQAFRRMFASEGAEAWLTGGLDTSPKWLQLQTLCLFAVVLPASPLAN